MVALKADSAQDDAASPATEVAVPTYPSELTVSLSSRNHAVLRVSLFQGRVNSNVMCPNLTVSLGKRVRPSGQRINVCTSKFEA